MGRAARATRAALYDRPPQLLPGSTSELPCLFSSLLVLCYIATCLYFTINILFWCCNIHLFKTCFVPTSSIRRFTHFAALSAKLRSYQHCVSALFDASSFFAFISQSFYLRCAARYRDCTTTDFPCLPGPFLPRDSVRLSKTAFLYSLLPR